MRPGACGAQDGVGPWQACVWVGSPPGSRRPPRASQQVLLHRVAQRALTPHLPPLPSLGRQSLLLWARPAQRRHRLSRGSDVSTAPVQPWSPATRGCSQPGPRLSGMKAEVAAPPPWGQRAGPLRSWKTGKAPKHLPAPPGLLGPPVPFRALVAEGDGWATCRLTSGLTAPLGLRVRVGRGHRGTVDHGPSTAGGDQLVPQCVFWQRAWKAWDSARPGVGRRAQRLLACPPHPRGPPATGSYLIQGHFGTGEDPIYYRAVREATASASPESPRAVEPPARPARAGEGGGLRRQPAD